MVTGCLEGGCKWDHVLWKGDVNNLSLARAGHSATAVGKMIYVLAGRHGSTFFTDLLRFDTETRTWEKIYNKLPFSARANHAAVLIGQSLWVIGGSNNDRVLGDVAVLDLDTLEWSLSPVRDEDELLTRTAHACEVSPLDNQDVLIYGGYGRNLAVGAGEYTWLDDLVVLHTRTGSVERIAPEGNIRPSARGYHSFTCFGTRCFLIGGRSDKGCVRGRQFLMMYDPLTRTWHCPQVAGAPPSARSSHRTVAHNNRLVLVGGASGDKMTERLADVHQLVVEGEQQLRWVGEEQPGQEGGERPQGRSAHTLTVVGSRVFLLCGYSGSGSLYKYAADCWSLEFSQLHHEAKGKLEVQVNMSRPSSAQAKGAGTDCKGQAPDPSSWRSRKRARTVPLVEVPISPTHPAQKKPAPVPVICQPLQMLEDPLCPPQLLLSEGLLPLACKPLSETARIDQGGESSKTRKLGQGLGPAPDPEPDLGVTGQVDASVEQLRCQLAECQTAHEVLAEENRRLREVNLAMKCQLAQLQNQQQQDRQNWLAAEQQRKASMHEAQQYQTLAEQRLSELQMSRHGLQEYQRKLVEATRKVEELTRQVTDISAENTLAEARVKECEVAVARLEAEVSTCQNQLRQERAEWEKYDAVRGASQDRLRGDHNALKEAHKHLQESMASLTKSLERAEAKASAESEALAQSRKEAAQQQLIAAQKLSDLERQVGGAREELSTALQRTAELEAVVDSLKRERDESRQTCLRMEQQNHERVAEAMALREQLQKSEIERHVLVDQQQRTMRDLKNIENLVKGAMTQMTPGPAAGD